MDTYVYQVGGKNYINLTNRCNNACDFCIRQNKVGIPGFSLWLEKEPEAGEVIAQLDAAGRATWCSAAMANRPCGWTF